MILPPKSGAPAIFLAPMEGVTDARMREALTSFGGFDYCVTEFFRVSQDPLPKKVFQRGAPELFSGSKTKSGTPLVVQLLGGDPDRMAISAQNAVAAGAKAIDINFGCPAPTVNRNDGGATLLKYPDRIFKIVKAVREALAPEIQVSAKLRLGWDSIDAIDRNAEMAAKGGASFITIHGRTRMAGYAPPAFWAPIGRVRRALDIPVVANGEIWTMDDFRRCREQTGCEHFMLGRGGFARPWLSIQIMRELENSKNPGRPDAPSLEVRAYMRRYADLCILAGDVESRILRRLKQWARFAKLGGSIDWFEQVKASDTVEDFFAQESEHNGILDVSRHQAASFAMV